jgi:hypothetical protein
MSNMLLLALNQSQGDREDIIHGALKPRSALPQDSKFVNYEDSLALALAQTWRFLKI